MRRVHSHAEQLVERLSSPAACTPIFAEPEFIEPAGAYTIDERAGHTRLVSGTDPLEAERLQIEGEDNVCATGFQSQCRRLAGIRIVGNRNTVFFGPHANITGADVTIEGSGNLVYVGAFATAGNVTVRVEGDGLTTAIGDRSMLSNRIFIGRPESRALFSSTSGERLDPPADVLIAAHCWIGRDVMIEPGSAIGRDSVVGQAAVVRGRFPEGAILIGSPARIAREGVTWARTWESTYAETLETKHYKQLFLKKAALLEARIAELSAAGSGAAAT